MASARNIRSLLSQERASNSRYG
ncbi:hypothetical protein CCACVL1_15474 [Corchorus capsularis]|uniref:Uncharacterized protein n=1 Tax=Corchorus capsularis TaxID=210143 RepID=A0A1R3I2B5_COCAP|nr:hypothetical protein CCACVL1_15474 [Corchorus capsularis]